MVGYYRPFSFACLSVPSKCLETELLDSFGDVWEGVRPLWGPGDSSIIWVPGRFVDVWT